MREFATPTRKRSKAPTRRGRLPVVPHAQGSTLQRAEVRQILQGTRAVQRSPSCDNQSQVDDILQKNPRGYPTTVTMFLHKIVRGDTFTGLAGGIRADNKVANVPDLVAELQALNKGVKSGKLGQCVVLIKSWTSPAWLNQEKRINCDERIDGFKKDPKLSRFASWEREKVADKDSTYHDVVDRVAKRASNLFTGRREEYVTFVEGLNNPWIGSLNVDECVAMPTGWVDPNIGTLPSKPADGAVTGDAAQAIATVYAEQTRTSANAQEQQKYIWLSLRKRVQTAVRGPSLTSVLDAGEYHAIGSSDYKAALEDLKKPSPTLAGVANAKKAVLDNWTAAMPANAGAFYFHWRDGSTPEACFGASKAATTDDKEKECAWKWAKKQAFQGGVTQSVGWLKRIRGDSAAPKERLGSMYIYP